MEESNELRIVVVGDEKCGKTALISRFINNVIPAVYKPTSFDKHITSKEVCGELFNIIIWDTSGSSNFNTVRPLSYGEADVFIICFKISDPVSLCNVSSRWIQEISQHSSAPVLLCGCMADLRSDGNTVSYLSKLGRSPVTQEQAMVIGRQIGVQSYHETAAAVSYVETFDLFSVAAMNAIDYRRLHAPAPDPVTSHVFNGSGGASLTRGQVQVSTSQHCMSQPHDQSNISDPSSSNKLVTGDNVSVVHSRSASQPVSQCPRSPPLPPRHHHTTSPDHSTGNTQLTRNSSIRSSLPLHPGRSKPPLPRSPTEVLSTSRDQGSVGSSKSRVAQLSGRAESGKNYESLKSCTSTGSTGSKLSSASSGQLSGGQTWSGPRDLNLPDTEDPAVLKRLEFVSPKAGVYRPVNTGHTRPGAASKKDKCSVM